MIQISIPEGWGCMRFFCLHVSLDQLAHQLCAVIRACTEIHDNIEIYKLEIVRTFTLTPDHLCKLFLVAVHLYCMHWILYLSTAMISENV